MNPLVMAVQQLLLVALIVVALMVIMGMFALTPFLNLYLQAKLSNAPVRMLDLIGMRLRRSDGYTIVISRIRAKKAGFDLDVSDLERHAVRGGNVARVVSALIAARAKGVDLGWEDAAEIDLEGRDVLAEVEAAATGAAPAGDWTARGA